MANEKQQKYELYLENEQGHKIKLNSFGRVPNVGETINFDMNYEDCLDLMRGYNVYFGNNSYPEDIRRLNNLFNKREYVVTNVKSKLEFELNELNLVPLSVEARVE